MTIPRVLLGAAIVAVLSIPLSAQQAPTGYEHVQCVKINPGKMSAAESFIAGASHKLGQSLVDSGHYANTFVLRTEMPRGTDAECDYLFVALFNGLPPAALSQKEVTAALQKADVPMTAEQLYAQEDELGKLVSDYFVQTQLRVGGAKKGDYLVVNSMSAPDAGACVAAQKKTWQPVEEEMVKAGKTSGWVVNAKRFPRGTKDGNMVSSVDIYPTWDAFLNEYSSISSAWQKVHPDMEFNSTMQQFEKQCTITHTVLYKVVDATAPAK